VLQLVDLLNTPSVTVNLQTALALTNLSLNRTALSLSLSFCERGWKLIAW